MAGMNNEDMIAQIASRHMGQPAPAPGQPAPQMQEAPQAPPPPPKADPAPTNMEKAQAKIAPNDPSKQSADAPINFLKVGEREYTEDQLKGTMSRYKDLNYKWQNNKPVIDVISQFQETARKNGHEPNADEMAKLVDAAVRAYIKNPEMGGQPQKPENNPGQQKQAMSAPALGDNSEGDESGAYEAWERENAVKLPPGFRETATTSKAMSAKMDQMMAMFQQIVQGGQAGQQAQQQAQQTMQQAQGVQADAATKMVSNNLTQAFAQNGLQTDPETRADFRMFAAQRGYDFPDFMDPQMAATVAADYKANKDAPEVARLREMAKKRQAFTGQVEGAPGAAGAGAAPAGDPMLANMISSAMGKRNM